MDTTTSNSFWMAPLQQLADDFGSWAPHLLAALLVLAVGLVAAWLCRYLASALFKVMKLEKVLQDLWFFRLWSRGLQGRRPTDSMASFVFCLILFATVLLAIRLLGVEGGEAILKSLLGVVPRVLSFMLILFLGALLAMFFSVLAQMALAGSGAQHPSFWGKVIAWCTFGVTVMFSLEPLGLVGRFLTSTVLILLGMTGLAAAIAFGLGYKDLAREFVIELLKEDKPDYGSPMTSPFVFMTSVEAVQLTGRRAASLLELYIHLKEADGASLYHHTHRFYRSHSFLGSSDRSDFALWAANNLKEEAVAERMGTLDLRDYRTLEEVREALLACMEPLMEDKERWARKVPPGLEFHFCKSVSLVLPVGHEAHNLEEFLHSLERVDVSCLYYHLIEAPHHYFGPERRFNNDFSQWLFEALGLEEKARALALVDPYRSDLEALREDILSLFGHNLLKAAARKVVERVARNPSGEAAAEWLKRWRKEA